VCSRSAVRASRHKHGPLWRKVTAVLTLKVVLLFAHGGELDGQGLYRGTSSLGAQRPE
jgi:hypothetical protein